MTSEAKIQREILLTVSKDPRCKIFRNETGYDFEHHVAYGLCKGSSDLIGWTELEVLPEHVGKRLAIFTALEVKTARGRPSKEQTNFINAVLRSGGYAGIVRSTDDAKGVIDAT